MLTWAAMTPPSGEIECKLHVYFMLEVGKQAQLPATVSYDDSTGDAIRKIGYTR
jgi:hypothetical protein